MSKRRFIGVLFRCCKVYGRAYLKADGTAYEARCPRCLKVARIEVSAQGSSSRFFSVG